MKLTMMLALSGTMTSLFAGVPQASVIDTRVAALMKHEHVNGLAVAVIDGGQVRYVRAFGWRNVERRLPLETDTILYGASLTKEAFAY